MQPTHVQTYLPASFFVASLSGLGIGFDLGLGTSDSSFLNSGISIGSGAVSMAWDVYGSIFPIGGGGEG